MGPTISFSVSRMVITGLCGTSRVSNRRRKNWSKTLSKERRIALKMTTKVATPLIDKT